MSAHEAAFKCGNMSDGRLVSLKTRTPELTQLITLFLGNGLTPNHWIGNYRSETVGENIILSDGRRKLAESDIETSMYHAEAFDRATCPTCQCGHFLADGTISFSDCLERHQYICEYKGGPSCPKGMFSIYGKCMGVVKNTVEDTADHANCFAKSRLKHQYRLATLENNQVR